MSGIAGSFRTSLDHLSRSHNILARKSGERKIKSGSFLSLPMELLNTRPKTPSANRHQISRYFKLLMRLLNTDLSISLIILERKQIATVCPGNSLLIITKLVGTGQTGCVFTIGQPRHINKKQEKTQIRVVMCGEQVEKRKDRSISMHGFSSLSYTSQQRQNL